MHFLMKYDYLIVGSGLFGSIFAREMEDAGAKCLVLEKRNHIGGNCYTKNINGINVHEYGPHIFHTDDERIWNYMNRWTKFNHFTYRPKVCYKNKLYSFPINLMTLYQLWGIKTPREAQLKLDEVKSCIKSPSNLQDWMLSQVGEEIYQKFIYGYTAKQWNKDPTKLPSSIIKRIPIRLTFDDNYFNDRFQGIPIGGYTKIFEKLLSGIDYVGGVDYLEDRDMWNSLATKIVYTGAIDDFFDNDEGELEWRSLRFEHETLNIKDYQGIAAINYTEKEIPFTRIIEHKHFEFGNQEHTIITKEYPQEWSKSKEKFYPVNDEKNNILYKKYKNRCTDNRYVFGGRLADYKYYDMHQVVASALYKSRKELS